MTTFALIHGAWHRGSHWRPTAELLRAAGHRVLTPDLPCDDPTAGLADYTAAVVASLAEHRPADGLVLVGHSLGGLTIPLVADAMPVAELVFLCALVPLPGASVADDLYADATTFSDGWSERTANLVRHGNHSTSWPQDGPAAIDTFFHDCDSTLAAAAAALLRPQSNRVALDACPLTSYPTVPARAIVCTGDRVLNANACARNAEERLGASVIRLAGGHSPMLAQPAALVDVLLKRS